MRCRQIVLATALAVGIAGSVASAASSGRVAVKVGFTVRGNAAASVTTTPGTALSFLARASMRKGDHIVVLAQRASESKLRSVAACPASPCTGSWREAGEVAVRFQAVLARGSGKSLAILGRSRVITVNWQAPPAFAQPGHYEGKSSQNEKFAFDVTADGRNVVNLQTGQINTTCPRSYTHSGDLSLPGPYAITADHTFSISIQNESITSQQGEAIKRSITIAGRFAGGIASGTLLVQYDWPSLGGPCSSGDQTWTIPRTG